VHLVKDNIASITDFDYYAYMRILIIEDDDRITSPLKEHFERQHHFVDVASDGQTGLEHGLANVHDVIILDIMLPQVDGLTVCRKLRETGSKAVIIMTTARWKTTDKIHGLDAGADDYLSKPYELDELTARIRAVMRRGQDSREPVLSAGPISLDPNSRVVKFNGRDLDLTPTEYRLLEHFMNNPKRAFSKEEIIEKLWPFDQSPTHHVIKTHIKGLRRKLLDANAPDIIETVYGHGYRLKQEF
jgi:two-component system response regulator QseB